MKTQENTTEIEVSVVMPCLNEQETLGICIQKAQNTLKALGIQGEVIVADNGSMDDSVAIAERLGAGVVHQKLRGYGAAYLYARSYPPTHQACPFWPNQSVILC